MYEKEMSPGRAAERRCKSGGLRHRL